MNEFKPKDGVFLKKVFKSFWPIFSFYWQESKPRLNRFIKIFKNFGVEKLIKKSLKILEIYFDKPNSQEVIIYLLMFPKHLMGGGSANVGKNKITVEAGNISSKGFKFSLTTILHETTHIFFQSPRSYFDNLLKEFLNSLNEKEIRKIDFIKEFGNNLLVIFREAITSSIIAGGIIDDTLFKDEIRKRFKLQLKNLNFLKSQPRIYFRKFTSYHLYPLNKKYLQQKRKIDKNYLKEVLKLIKKFNKLYKNFTN